MHIFSASICLMELCEKKKAESQFRFSLALSPRWSLSLNVKKTKAESQCRFSVALSPRWPSVHTRSVKRDLIHSQKRPTIFCIPGAASPAVRARQWGSSSWAEECQKRPNTVSKETYYRVYTRGRSTRSARRAVRFAPLSWGYEEEDTCVWYEEEDTCVRFAPLSWGIRSIKPRQCLVSIKTD